MQEAEELWDDLLAYVEEGRVLPVVGPELLAIEVEGQSIPLYRAVAEALLARYKLPADGPGGAAPAVQPAAAEILRRTRSAPLRISASVYASVTGLPCAARSAGSARQSSS